MHVACIKGAVTDTGRKGGPRWVKGGRPAGLVVVAESIRHGELPTGGEDAIEGLVRQE